MNEIIIGLCSLSLKASCAVLAVLVLRFVLKSAPKWTSCLLWAPVALRLLLPFSVESILSLIPNRETVEAVMLAGPMQGIVRTEAEPMSADGGTYSWLFTVWLTGVLLLILYAIFSYFKMRSRLAVSVQPEKGIFICDDIDKPFIFGVLKPRICLPSGMPEDQMSYVLQHERAHIKRGDHIWKPLSFLLAALHWFNPILWLAYALFGQDVELACDEAAIKDLDHEQRKAYSNALLTCGMERKMHLLCPVAFGEVSIQARVVSVLSYRKQNLWRALTAIAMCFVLAVCFLTDPVTASVAEEAPVAESEPVQEEQEEEPEEDQPSTGRTHWYYKQGYGIVYSYDLQNIEVRGNGIAIANLKCCPRASSKDMVMTYLMDVDDWTYVQCSYERFGLHRHETGHVYAVVRCKSCGSDVGAYYVGTGYHCESAEKLVTN